MFNVFTWMGKYSPSERWLLLKLLLLLPLADLILRLAGFSRTMRCVVACSGSRQTRASADLLITAQRIAELARIVGLRLPINATCLRQALVVTLLLRRMGLDAQIKFGVTGALSRVPAHAWVEVEAISLDPQSAQQRPFSATPPNGH